MQKLLLKRHREPQRRLFLLYPQHRNGKLQASVDLARSKQSHSPLPVEELPINTKAPICAKVSYPAGAYPPQYEIMLPHPPKSKEVPISFPQAPVSCMTEQHMSLRTTGLIPQGVTRNGAERVKSWPQKSHTVKRKEFEWSSTLTNLMIES